MELTSDMVFSAPLFLFLLLPLALALHVALRKTRHLRNLLLLGISLVFYAWGEGYYVFLLLISIVWNYLAGIAISYFPRKKLCLAFAIIGNLALLAYYKYAGFLIEGVNTLTSTAGYQPIIQPYPIHLPIGLSFFTFQALSYLIDLYRKQITVQKNPLNLALYIALFPQLIAGPIVRYTDIESALSSRRVDHDDIIYGMRRFIIGLSKKVLLADNLAIVSHYSFSTSPDLLTTPMAWFGLLCATLQLYFDFSGYSDMAIGLGRMFGFRFKENFQHPFTATSMRNFWRKWHISLSTWLRDYLYIPLGGNKCGELRTWLNLFIVFFLCGLWHGASWNFILWGLFQGTFMALERALYPTKTGQFLSNNTPYLLRSVYVNLVFMLACVLFFSPDLITAKLYYHTLLGQTDSLLFMDISPLLIIVLLSAIIGSTPICLNFYNKHLHHSFPVAAALLRDTVLTFLLFLCLITSAAKTYVPFIYFRF